jgi:hypothetical protein
MVFNTKKSLDLRLFLKRIKIQPGLVEGCQAGQLLQNLSLQRAFES